MKRNLLILMLLILAVSAYGQTVIGYTGFEEPATASDNSTKYTDADNTTNHTLVNNTGQASVAYTSVGGEMGFSSYYTNTLNDVGLSDGDYIGVTTYTPSTGSMADGTQAYQLSDTDGLITVTLDPITVSTATTIYFSASYFINDDGWETADYFKMWLTVDGTSEIVLLNTNGSDIDDLGIEGAWTIATQEITASSSVVFHFELQSNSANETIWVDKISFTTGSAIPNAPVANAGSDIYALTNSTVTLDGSSSSDIDNNIASYQWAMTWGTQVSPTLTNANSSIATFTAPSTNQDFLFELIVTDSTGLVDRDTVAVAVREAQDSKLIFSEYIEGSSNNKALEIYNVDSNSVSLTGYVVKRASNGGGWGSGSEIALSGTLAGNDVYVITNDGATITDITSNSDITSDVTWFNGNDALGLFLNDVLIDVIGDPNSNANFAVAGIADAAVNHTLVRKSSIETGNTNWVASAGTSEDNSEWLILDNDYTSDLGSHTAGPVAYAFSNATVVTTFPQAGSEIEITVDITPGDGAAAPTSVKVFYGTGGTQPNQADMWLESGNTYAGNIPALSSGNIVLDYYISAIGSETVNSGLYNMTVAGAVTNISDIHSNITSYEGQLKTIEGVITIGAGVLRDDRTSCYIQDASGRGLNLYATPLYTDLTRGTKVKLVGEVDLYFSTLEIKNFSYSVVSTGQALPAAQSVTVVGANSDNLEGTLATVTGTLAEVQDFTTSKNMILTSGTDSTVVKIWPTTGIDASSYTVGNDYAITGVGSKYSDEHQLLVGYASDINVANAICEDCSPEKFELSKAYPNPFNPSTTIEFSLVDAGEYEISVYNITGQKLSVLSNGYAQPGVYKYVWNAADFTSGVYFIRLNAGSQFATQKVVLIK